MNASDQLRQRTQQRSDFIEQTALWFAERAFAASQPLRGTDPEIAQMICRGMRRKLRAEMRRYTRDEPDFKEMTLELAEMLYTGRILALEDEWAERGAPS